MAGKDLYNRVTETVQLHPAAITATNTATAGVDLQGYESAMVFVQVGAIGAGESIVFEIQDGSTAGTLAANFSAVAAAELIGGTIGTLSGTSDANQLIARGYIGDARYLRVAVTGLTGTVECNAFVLASDQRSPSTR